MTLDAAAQLLTTALLLIQSVSANPSLPQDVRIQAASTAEKAITEATRAIATRAATDSPISCTITADKSNYFLGEVLVFNWTSTNATSVEFIPDTRKEALPVPTGKLFGVSGQYREVAPARGYPFVTLKVTNDRGESAMCSEMVQVY